MDNRERRHWFPTFVLEQNGALERLDYANSLDRPAAWREALITSAPLIQPAVIEMESSYGFDWMSDLGVLR